ncbi:MAG: acyltransferase [Terriglobus sp.]
MANRKPLPNLTSVRFLAAVYVICFHFIPATHASMGYTGVSLFFVLSGFILAYNHPVVHDRKQFYIARFARIYPLYAFALLLGTPRHIMHYWHMDRLTGVMAELLSFAMMQSWFPGYRFAINIALWTLPIEAMFYVSFPLLLPWVSKRINHWKVWIALFVALEIAHTAVFMAATHLWSAQSLPHALTVLTLPIFRLSEFMIGMFIGLHFLHNHPRFNGWHVSMATGFLVASSAGAFFLSKEAITYSGLLALPYAILIYVLAGWESRWFGHPWLQLGGEISYGMYLLQFPVYTKVQRLFLPRLYPPGFVLLPAICIVSYCSYRLLEKPARRMILNAFGYRSSPKPIPTPGLTV